MRSSALVEDKGLPHADSFETGVDNLVATGSLPESGGCGAVGSSARWILLIFVAEEVPVVLWRRSNSALLCNNGQKK